MMKSSSYLFYQKEILLEDLLVAEDGFEPPTQGL